MTNDHGRAAVYRCYDAAGTLLYIGSSNNPRTRYCEHSCSALKPWWPQVVRKDETWFEERSEAQKAEAEAIKTEAPLYNVRLQASSLNVTLGVRFSEDEAAVIDAARGTMSRSAFLRSAALARLSAERNQVDWPEPADPEPEPRPGCRHPAAAVDELGVCRECGADVF